MGMNIHSSGTALLVAMLVWLPSQPASAQVEIFWNSDLSAANKTSDGQSMDHGFRFELGVFAGSFVPTPSNTSNWAANWHKAGSAIYSDAEKRFVSSLDVTDNLSPFTAGKTAYIWGFRGGPTSGEWILFRAASWTWPNGSTFPPGFVNWRAKDATAILGSVNGSGSPFLMRSAAVSGALPPSTSWEQWQEQFLGGEVLNGPDDDPDRDGMPNVLEFAMGTTPAKPGAIPAMPLDWLNVSGSDYLRITVPRRKDHLVDCTVQVSSDLVNWYQGPAHVQVMDDGLNGLVVRDLTPLSPSLPRRFMRVKTQLPPP